VEAAPCGERENESRGDGEKSGLELGVFQFCPRRLKKTKK
jgi:hypothetical protein